MKLLFLTPQLPYPPHQGTSLRNYNLIAHLARRHDIDLLSFTQPERNLQPDNPLLSTCRSVATIEQPARSRFHRMLDTIRQPLPDMALRLLHPGMDALVRNALSAAKYDVVQIEGIEMAPYALIAARMTENSKQPPRLVFDNHNCEYLLQKRTALMDLRQPRRFLAAVYSIIQWQKLVHYERLVCTSVTDVVAVSHPDANALQKLDTGLQVTVIPNGIDLDYYATVRSSRKGAVSPRTRHGQRQESLEATIVQTPPMPPSSRATGGARRSDTAPHRLVFIGKMDYRPNIDAVLWFAGEVLPILSSAGVDIHFDVIGMSPHRRLDALASNPRVTIVGGVEDVRPYLVQASAYVIPMRVGGGTRFKALEAMAAHVPIVSTTLGVEGINVRHQEHMLIGDSPADFATQVQHLLLDQAAGGTLGRQLADHSYQFVAAHYSWSAIIPSLEQLYLRSRQTRTGEAPSLDT